MPKDKNARKLRIVRHARVRRKVSGTPERPRLCVFRSSRHIYCQVIDDTRGETLVSASSVEDIGNDGKPGWPQGVDFCPGWEACCRPRLGQGY